MLTHIKRAGARVGLAVLRPSLAVAAALVAAATLVLATVHATVVRPAGRAVLRTWRRIPRRVRRAAAAVTVAGVTTFGVAACHQPADVVCEYYKPHAADVVTFHHWQDLPDNGGSYDRGRYNCSARHSTGSYHHYCVYAPEHQSPPDNVWSVIGSCSF